MRRPVHARSPRSCQHQEGAIMEDAGGAPRGLPSGKRQFLTGANIRRSPSPKFPPPKAATSRPRRPPPPSNSPARQYPRRPGCPPRFLQECFLLGLTGVRRANRAPRENRGALPVHADMAQLQRQAAGRTDGRKYIEQPTQGGARPARHVAHVASQRSLGGGGETPRYHQPADARNETRVDSPPHTGRRPLRSPHLAVYIAP